MLISEENRYHEGGFTHLDHDGDKLVSVSVNEFVAWDFTNGEKFCILGTAKSEQSTLRYISGLKSVFSEIQSGFLPKKQAPNW